MTTYLAALNSVRYVSDTREWCWNKTEAESGDDDECCGEGCCCQNDECIDDEDGEGEETDKPRRFTRCWNFTKKHYTNFQQIIKSLVENKYFQQGILGAILINTLSMGIEYHDQVNRRIRMQNSLVNQH